MKIKTYLNELEIIASGNAFVTGTSRFKIEVEELKFVFQFAARDDEPFAEAIIENEEMIIKISRLAEARDGRGVYDPWVLGEINGRELSITFNLITRTNRYNRTDYGYLIEYALLLGKETKNE